MNFSTKLFAAAVSACVGLTGFHTLGFSDETLPEKVETGVDEVKKDSKKSVRKAKKKHRDSTGQGNVMKDAKDQVKNTGDDIEHEAKKAERKVD